MRPALCMLYAEKTQAEDAPVLLQEPGAALNLSVQNVSACGGCQIEAFTDVKDSLENNGNRACSYGLLGGVGLGTTSQPSPQRYTRNP